MIPDLFRPPAPGTPAWALRRLRRLVWLRNNDSGYRYVPSVRRMVNAAILSVYRDVRDCGDVGAFREAQRLLVPAAVRS